MALCSEIAPGRYLQLDPLMRDRVGQHLSVVKDTGWCIARSTAFGDARQASGPLHWTGAGKRC